MSRPIIAEGEALRLADALEAFGTASKAVFRPDLPTALGPGSERCVRLLLPARRQEFPAMNVVDTTAIPPAVTTLPLAPHLLYPVYAIGLSGGVLLDALGHVAGSDGTLYVESFRDRSFLDSAVYTGCDFAALAAQSPVEMPGRYLSLVYGIGATNWYHWLVENLGRLCSLGSVPEHEALKIIVPRGLSPARRESLALMIPPERWIEHDGRAWRCEELWLPSFGAVRGSVRPEPLAWLRRVLADRLGLGAPAGTRLYVSRGDAGFRRLANEAAVVEALARFGFQPVSLTGRSFAEQALLFHDASIVVAPHGAGLANLLLARPGTQLVELLPPHGDGVLSVYHTLAMVLGQRWLGIKCPFLPGGGEDFTLDPAVLGAVLPSLL